MRSDVAGEHRGADRWGQTAGIRKDGAKLHVSGLYFKPEIRPPSASQTYGKALLMEPLSPLRRTRTYCLRPVLLLCTAGDFILGASTHTISLPAQYKHGKTRGLFYEGRFPRRPGPLFHRSPPRRLRSRAAVAY